MSLNRAKRVAVAACCAWVGLLVPAYATTYPIRSTDSGYQDIAGTFGEFRSATRFHLGTDIATCGKNVRSADGGTARYFALDTNNGYRVVVNGLYQYLHLREHDANIMAAIQAGGQGFADFPVTEGNDIGVTSNTGNNVPCHLHFIVGTLNPLGFFDVPDTVNGLISTVYLRIGSTLREIQNNRSYNLSGTAEVVALSNDLSNISRNVGWARILSELEGQQLQNHEFIQEGGFAGPAEVYSISNPASAFNPYETWYRLGAFELAEAEKTLCIRGYDFDNRLSRQSQEKCIKFKIDRRPITVVPKDSNGQDILTATASKEISISADDRGGGGGGAAPIVSGYGNSSYVVKELKCGFLA